MAETLAFPFIVLYFLWRAVRDWRYATHFPERAGFLPHSLERTASGGIWLHAASVGEVISSAALLRRLRETIPSAPLYVSTATAAGRRVAEARLSSLVSGIFYGPVDFCFAIRRVLRMLRPQVVVVLETEIWPNLYHEAKRFGCGLAVVNGRIGDRTLPKYLATRWFFKAVLAWPDVILAQSERDRLRYLSLGAPPERTINGGNLKYDFETSHLETPESVRRFIDAAAPEKIWIAASTMPARQSGDVDEDEALADIFRRLSQRHRGLLMILAPRRPERFDEVAQKLDKAGVRFVRRTALPDGDRFALPGVLLLDTIGELASLFTLGDVVFMGGTLASRGGHNILEPAFFGRPVIAGPHMENFADIAEEFTERRAMFRVQDATGLGEALELFLTDRKRRNEYGERARTLADARRGATGKAAAEIHRLYELSIPRRLPPAFPLLLLLSRIWAAGSRAKQRRDAGRRKRLETPVISVGSIAMGGAGKTPFVLWLAQELKQRGQSPAILTRGYGRRSPERVLTYTPGEAAPARITGDEPQIFLRHAVCPLGIGANRFKAGIEIERRFDPDALLLDDGFQHRRLARDLDIVMIDALDPLAGGHLFPAGRLREPREALERADILVLCRTEAGRTYSGLLAALAAANPNAPLFRSRVVPERWFELRGTTEYAPRDLPFSRTGALCGLANPESFWRTVASLGIHPAHRWAFPDHHRYAQAELIKIREECLHDRIEVLLTTEKDTMNLPDDVRESLGGLPVFWLRIGIEVEDAPALLGHVSAGSQRGRERSGGR